MNFKYFVKGVEVTKDNPNLMDTGNIDIRLILTQEETEFIKTMELTPAQFITDKLVAIGLMRMVHVEEPNQLLYTYNTEDVYVLSQIAIEELFKRGTIVLRYHPDKFFRFYKLTNPDAIEELRWFLKLPNEYDMTTLRVADNRFCFK